MEPKGFSLARLGFQADALIQSVYQKPDLVHGDK
jgi:hypothetical protein